MSTELTTILHTEASLGWGGQEKRTMRVMTGLNKSRYRVLLACHPKAKIRGEAQAAGIEVLDAWFRLAIDPVSIMALRTLIKRNKVDLVHTHSSRDGWNAGFAARLCGVPVVRTRHLAGRIANPWVYKKLADKVITVGDYMRQQFVDVYGLPSAQVETVMTGIDLERFSPQPKDSDLRAQWGVADDDVVLVTVAVMRRKKGHEAVVEALAQLHKEGLTKAKALFVGDGPWRPHIEAKVADLGLQDHVILAGQQQDVPRYLASADMFVLASLEEALGTSLLEAMAMELPVAGTRVGGIPSIVEESRGVLFEPESPSSLAAAIRPMVESADLRREKGQNGANFARESASVAQMVAGTERIYQNLL